MISLLNTVFARQQATNSETHIKNYDLNKNGKESKNRFNEKTLFEDYLFKSLLI